MEELSDFYYFRLLYDFLHSEIDDFAIGLLARTMDGAPDICRAWSLTKHQAEQGFMSRHGEYPNATGKQHKYGLCINALQGGSLARTK